MVKRKIELPPAEQAAREIRAILDKFGCQLVATPTIVRGPLGFTLSANVDVARKVPG